MNPSDKTQLPGGGVDHTVLRPTPGRRGAPSESAPLNRQPPPAALDPVAAPPRAVTPQPGRGPVLEHAPQPAYAAPPPGYGQAQEPLASRLDPNPLTRSAATLLAVYRQTRHAPHHADVAGLHRRLQNEVRLFEEKARSAAVKPEIILAARYLLCSVLDEAVMHTPWGEESAWGQHTLLSIFHNETFGGEKCFLILNRLMQSPADNIDVLELFAMCLALGFEGKYRHADRGRDALENIRTELYRMTAIHRADAERDLSANWRGLRAQGKPLIHRLPLWVVASVFALLVCASFAALKVVVRWQSEPVLEQLQVLGPDAPLPDLPRAAR